MNILVACEYSAIVRDAFINLEKGHHVVSCDKLETESGGPHYKGDIFTFLTNPFCSPWYEKEWDLMIAHPPCTYLSSSGLHWNLKDPERAKKTEEALEFVSGLWGQRINKICIENPVGCISTRLPRMGKPQYIQPYDFCEDASKKTGLWLKNLPPLEVTQRISGRIVEHKGKHKMRWANQTDSGQNKLGPSEDRAKERSRTFPGIAQAMAEQWG